MKNKAEDTRGIILLAGGNSLRMGQDKWWLKIGETTLLERMLFVLYPLGAELWIIAAGAEELNDPSKFPDLSLGYPNLHMTHDYSKNIGPL
jgi:molybdopterin-guanine dinucleotide biosynthesis protein A